MKMLRLVLASATLGLLVVGYAASQWAFFHGESAEYAERLSEPGVPILCLALTLAAAALAVLREEESPTT